MTLLSRTLFLAHRREHDSKCRWQALGAVRSSNSSSRVALAAALRAVVIGIALAIAGVGAAADPLADEIAARIGSRGAPVGQNGWFEHVYGSAGPVWFTSQGARPAVASALRELRAAADRGLNAQDYDVETLQREIEAASRPGESPQSVARADVAMTSAVLRLLADARFGRARPEEVEAHYRVHAKDAPFVAAFRDAVASDRVAALADAAEPAFPMYARLKALLAQYRDLAAQPPITLPPLATQGMKVRAGDRYQGAAALHALLVRLGDLPPNARAPADDRLSARLVAALVRFKQRHALPLDGVLDQATFEQLAVPAQARVRQIELSLERLRWLADLAPGPVVAINIPSFRLWAFADASMPDHAALSMGVIVGRAMRTETPVFIGDMRYVEFSPYWNVPPSIVRNELLPKLARDPALMARDNMEVVGGDGNLLQKSHEAMLGALRSGEVRLRQRPGPKNALGGVKFGLPNAMNVYLHDTPTHELFGRTRRDFSHGCIRLSDPAALARFVLRDRPDWTAERIDAAMASNKNTVVPLSTAIPVVIFYTTAVVDDLDIAYFLPDVYGHDRALQQALARGR